jgi:D-glycero-alpha-D-manno-heptose-7-phosphate kinase
VQTASPVACSAPTRIDLAGGTIDIWPLYLFHDGASTINAAISLRARAEVFPRADGAIEVRSIDTGRQCRAAHWSEMPRDEGLSLLALLARHYRLENATLITRGESPAGAGIAGSSALAIAACGALARWTGGSCEADDLLRVAMNVECQAIRVPTGVQDYRPALYGGIAAIELGVDGIRRVGLDVDPGELERRIVLAYTGAPRNSGTNNWEITKRHLDGDRQLFDCFERIRDTAVAMREALQAGDWDEVGRQIAREWENRKRLAAGVTTPTIEDLIARATAAGAEAAKVCGAGGGGCLFCYGPPDARAAIAGALAAGGARVLDYRIEMEGLRLG